MEDVARPDWRGRSALLSYFLLPFSGVLLNASATGRDTEAGVLALEAIGAVAFGLSLILVHGFLWFFAGSRLLGYPSQPGESLRIVARAVRLPGTVAVIVAALFLASALALNSIPRPSLEGIERLCGLWAICAVVAAFKRTFSASAGRVALFVLWLVALVFVGVVCFSALRRLFGAA